MRVWVLVAWETDIASDTLGVFGSRERAERHAVEDAGRELAWKEQRDERGRGFRWASAGPFSGYAIEEFELVE